jgi:hypothetical protein
MLRRKVLDPADMAQPPTKAEVVPYLWKGAVLAFRMVVTFGKQAMCVVVRGAWSFKTRHKAVLGKHGSGISEEMSYSFGHA